jgi:oligopeptide transport system substrate-binding protein
MLMPDRVEVSTLDHMSGTSWWVDPAQRSLLERRLATIRIGRRKALGFAAAAGGAGAAAVLGACVLPPAAQTETPRSADAPVGAAPAAQPSPAADSKSAPAPGTLRRPIDREPLHFDYGYDLYAGGDWTVSACLLKFDADLQAVPDLAERWEPNADGSVWMFTIRQGARWSNGEAITAHDFVWSWKRQLDPASKAPFAGFLYDVRNAEAFNQARPDVTRDAVGVAAADDRTLVVTLEGPRAYFPVLTAFVATAPAHRASVEKHGTRWTEPANGVWSGPTKLTEWEHHRYFVLERNEQYWDAANVKLRRVVRPIMPFSTWLLAYENDEIDYVERGPIGEYKRVRTDPKLSKELFTFSLTGTWYLVPHVKMAPFDDKRVRLAMAHAIDREAIVAGVLQGVGQPAYTFNPPGFPGHNPDRYDDLTRYDPKLAMELLKDTPYQGGKNWPKIALTHRDEGDAPKAAAAAMIQMLKQNLGMAVDQVVGEPKETYDRMFKGEIQLMWVRWYADYPDPNNMQYQAFYGGHTSGRRQVWQNDAFDKLANDAKGVADQDRRMQMYRDADRAMLEDGAAIFVYHPYNYALLKSRVTGMPRNKAGELVPSWGIFARMYDHLTVG